ncbi:MAG: hypothetical protein HY470_01770, partial [Candidatus Ryanbacteria bacterium]|nr:hypothetical protein [Candidatus Ryanbacteria bacterium]
MRLWRKKSHRLELLSPDEVFLDASEIPGISRERLEGVIERPIPKGSFATFAAFLLLAGFLFSARATWLSVVRGEELSERSQKNFIHTTYLDPPRGVIYDRTGVIIASNEAFTDDKGDIRYR